MSDRLQPELHLKRLEIALGMLAPAGTAPREALEDLWEACQQGADPRKAVSALQQMLKPAWGDRESYLNPPELPKPDGSYTSGLSLEEALDRYEKVGQTALS